MSKFVMTRNQRVTFFHQVTIHLGSWDKAMWGDSYHPKSMSSVKEMFPVMESIITSMLKHGIFTNEVRLPDGEAIFNKLVEGLSVNPNMDTHQLKNTRVSRMAAYEGGFLSMDDVIHLDKIHTYNIDAIKPKYSSTFEDDFDSELLALFQGYEFLAHLHKTGCDDWGLKPFEDVTIETVEELHDEFIGHLCEEYNILTYSPEDQIRIMEAYNNAFGVVIQHIQNRNNAGAKFDLMKDHGLTVGTILESKYDPTIRLKVIPDGKVEYMFEDHSFTHATRLMKKSLGLSHNSDSYCGAHYWRVVGDDKTLYQRGKESGLYV